MVEESFDVFIFFILFDFCKITDMNTITFSKLEFLFTTFFTSEARMSIIFFPVEFFGKS